MEHCWPSTAVPETGQRFLHAQAEVTMPRAPRRCPGDNYECPNLIAGGQKYCPNHTRPWRGPRTASSHATTTAEWPALRDFILERDGYRCRIRYPGICIGTATVVDKETPAARRPDLALDERNLRAACEPCNDHKARTADRKGSDQRKR